MGKIRNVSVDQLVNAPLGAGTLLLNVDASLMNPEGFLSIIRGTAPADMGRHISNMTAAPSVADSTEMQDITESLVGLNVDLKGAHRIVKISTELTAELASLTVDNLKLIRPDYVSTDTLGGGTKATVTIGTTNAALLYTAKNAGTVGNGARIQYVNPTIANAVLSVTVAGSDITVNLANGATAGTITSTVAQIRDAVNASVAASALVLAALATGSDGTGLAAATAFTSLTGGVNGTKIGSMVRRSGRLLRSHYQKNIVYICPTISNVVGYAYVLENVLNANEDFDFEPDENGEIFGVEVTMRAHSDGSNMDITTGEFGTPSYILVYDPAAEV